MKVAKIAGEITKAAKIPLDLSKMLSHIRTRSLILALAAFACVSARAAVLDWNAVNWTTTFGTGTTASQTFNNVDGTTVDVTITVSAGPNTANSELINAGTLPDDVSTPINHNYNPTDQSLLVDVNYTNRNNDFVRFTITFSEAVSNVNFELWDIDLGNNPGVSTYQDLIQNFTQNGSATSPTFTLLGSDNQDGSTAVDAAIVGNTIVGVGSNGSTTSNGNENDALNSGDVRVLYSGSGITSVSFEYWSGSGVPPLGSALPTNPTLQRIALHDILFTAIPEVNTGLFALLACGMAVGASLLGRERYRARLAMAPVI